ncbi:hypothetical protein D9M68_924740 [compost metagenome]
MRKAIIKAAMDALETPFRHQGRVPGLGMDCAGVLVHCFQRLGLPYHDESGYPRNPYDGQLEKILDSQPSLRRIAVDEAGAGDVLVMRMVRAPQHIAIHAGQYNGHPYVIHGSEQHGKVCLHRLDAQWFGRVMRAYCFIEGSE